MPELPEVETIRRDLLAAVRGRRIVAAHVLSPEIVRGGAPEDLLATLAGRRIEAVERVAKQLLITLSGGWVWVIHLMLEGQLLLVAPGTPLEPDTRLTADLDDGRQLRLRDVVGYAWTRVVPHEHLREALKIDTLGPEPIAPGFDLAAFEARLVKRRGRIKPLLLKQQVFAGIGNIYADEALFRAGIRPDRRADTLSPDERRALCEAVVAVLQEGIAHRGTTARGGRYRDLHGRPGHHQAFLKVFRRAGEPCPGCAGEVVQTELGGRETFYCPACQR